MTARHWLKSPRRFSKWNWMREKILIVFAVFCLRLHRRIFILVPVRPRDIFLCVPLFYFLNSSKQHIDSKWWSNKSLRHIRQSEFYWAISQGSFSAVYETSFTLSQFYYYFFVQIVSQCFIYKFAIIFFFSQVIDFIE